ncbi:MAG: hypothetical protein Q4Q03_08210, partial [Bowdeniella nasicola]|nr:hypothetical protein [Bowdeniella nasicola]
MRETLRILIAAGVAAAMSVAVAPHALAEGNPDGADSAKDSVLKVKEPVQYAEAPAPEPAIFGPFCGLEGLNIVPEMPTTAPFVMEDDSIEYLPVKLINKQNGSVMDEAAWKAAIFDLPGSPDGLAGEDAWGPEVTWGGIRMQINAPGHPSDGKSGPWYYVKRYRMRITGQETATVEVTAGTSPQLPEELYIYYMNEWRAYNIAGARKCATDGAEGWIPSKITWDPLTEAQQQLLQTPGAQFDLHGTVAAPVPGDPSTTVNWERTGGRGKVDELPGLDYGFDATVTIQVTDVPAEPDE